MKEEIITEAIEIDMIDMIIIGNMTIIENMTEDTDTEIELEIEIEKRSEREKKKKKEN